MTRKEQLAFCRICLNRQLNRQGMVCKLTAQAPAFDLSCDDFELDKNAKQKRAARDASKAYYTVEGGEEFTPVQKYKHTRILGGIIIMFCAIVRLATIYTSTNDIDIKSSVLLLIGFIVFLIGLLKKKSSNT